MKGIFSPDGIVYRVLDVLTDIFVLSILWLLCSIPVVTLGAATTALYDAVVRSIRYKKGGAYRRFFHTFRSDLGTSVLTTLFWIVILGIGIFSLFYLRAMGEQNETFSMFSIVYYILLLIPVGTACWVFPVLSRFTYGFGGLNLTAFRLALGCLPRTVILTLSTLVILEAIGQYVFPVCFLPACLMLLWSLFIEPVFTRLGGGLGKDAEEQKDEEPPQDA